jgi:hypothetical protein
MAGKEATIILTPAQYAVRMLGKSYATIEASDGQGAEHVY